MAKVSLRTYNHEIEGMIEGGHLDESIAHCQYILKTFPMHVETYRLLGKSFLEARRYGDAADIFQRALSSVPDDFVSHVGMSIIKDDEGKLDEAIWHMERAFEVQPSNPAIQGELRRLYGRRDGVEPPKIRLSRDALANMYSQGELFNQAIAEIRSVLAEDPNRPDLQVMLARAYYRGGQKVEAAEMASTLLKKIPYCMDALRILVDVLPGTARAENTQVYRSRLRLLDPYSAFTNGSVFGTDQVGDQAVTIERFEYTGGGSTGAGPDWASSLGIKLTGEKRSDQPPEWLNRAGSAEQAASSFAPEPAAPSAPDAPVPAAPAAGDAVPDWMRSAGWQESTGTAQEESLDFSETTPTEPAARADIPDWLKSMAPAGAADTTEPESESANESFLGGEVPDWMKDAGAALPIPPAEAGAEFTPEPEPAQPDEPALPSVPAPEIASVDSEPAAPLEDETKPTRVVSGLDGEAFQPSGEVKPLDIGDDALGWLESLAAKQGAKPEELLTQPQERSDEMPDWLNKVDGDQAGSIPLETTPDQFGTKPLEQVGLPSQELPLVPDAGPDLSFPVEEDAVPLQSPPDGTAQPVEIADDTMAWLERLAANQGAKPEELLTKPEDRPDTIPGWIQEATSEQSADQTQVPLSAADDLNAGPEATPDWIQRIASEPAPAAEAPATPAPQHAGPDEDATITNWLSGLDKADEASALTSPAPVGDAVPTPQDELPDWLKDMEKPADGGAEPEADAPKLDADLPEWLRQPSTPGQTQMLTPMESRPIQPPPEPEMPAWMDEAAPVSEQASRTVPEEWVPVEKAPGVFPESTVQEDSADESAPPVPNLPIQAEPPIPAAAPASVRPSVVPPAIKGTGPLAHVPAQDKDAELLTAAQLSLDGNNLQESMGGYAKLIKKGRLLDEVIHDLREALDRHPVDVIIWQTLGDAYMRANRLQDALDAYTKAEELLR